MIACNSVIVTPLSSGEEYVPSDQPGQVTTSTSFVLLDDRLVAVERPNFLDYLLDLARALEAQITAEQEGGQA
jgi:hypothetical protein